MNRNPPAVKKTAVIHTIPKDTKLPTEWRFKWLSSFLGWQQYAFNAGKWRLAHGHYTLSVARPWRFNMSHRYRGGCLHQLWCGFIVFNWAPDACKKCQAMMAPVGQQ